MKRWLIALMVGTLFLNGCGSSSQTSSLGSSQTESSESVEATLTQETAGVSSESNKETSEETRGETSFDSSDEVETTTEVVEEPFPFLDEKVAIGNLGNTWYIPNEEIEELSNCELYLTGHAILAKSTVIDMEEGAQVVLKLISLEDGSLLGEAIVPTSEFISIQTNEEGIGLCDSGIGYVKIFDNTLQEIATYEREADWENWYLSTDLETLYTFDLKEGVFATKLSSEEDLSSEKDFSVTGVILDNITDVYVKTKNPDSVVFSYTDKESQKIISKSLNLRNGMLEPLPVVGDVASGVFVKDTWLIGDSADWGMYDLITKGERRNVSWTDNRFELLPPQGHLFSLNLDGRKLTLYEVDGTFVSTCEFLQEEDFFIGQNMLWSDLWNGYFFLYYGGDVTPKLVFWDISVPTTGEGLILTEEVQQGGSSVASHLYEQADVISEKYGVEILISDECQLDYDDFTACATNDEVFIEQTLDTLERALSAYPEGFFEQLCYGNVQKIQIELVRGLLPKNSDAYAGSYAGFTREKTDYYLMVLDVYHFYEGTFYHEIAHIIDKRLAWDASIREEALFSEEAWLALQPEGFAYPYTYGELSQETLAFVNSGYFVMDYSCRYPTEDRATMMENAMYAFENNYIFAQNPYLYEKLRYYSQCIRDCFDTTGWDEVVLWEKILQ